jgi:uncharacterized protein YecA (UPF0149 family)
MGVEPKPSEAPATGRPAHEIHPTIGQPAPEPLRNTQYRPARNDFCWCGSGKKYKKCHLPQDEKK